MTRYSHFRAILRVLFLLIACAAPLRAQSSNVDPSFNAVPSTALATDAGIAYVVQPDGKVIVYSAPTMMVNGAFVGGIFRLNADGTTDSTFSYCGCGGIGVSSVLLAPDGKIILAGTTSPNHAKMIRLIPVLADYDGDGKTDLAIYRPSDGGWYIYNSGNGSITTIAFGINTDRPVAADYDGDGRADIAVFRPSTGIWYLLRSTAGFAGYQFGISTDTAIPGALIP